MLKALYDYGIRHNLTLPAGYVSKTVKAYISLSQNGKVLGIIMGDTEAVAVPDIGSLANGTDKSNILVEKRSVVIPLEDSAKSRFFRNALREAGKTIPAMLICADALENADAVAEMSRQLDAHKVKPTERISFRVDGISILENRDILPWWTEFRKQFQSSTNSGSALCLITGEPTVPMTTTTPITGLKYVGGHARGDALICFDKNAFCSYGLKKAENAPVSEEAFSSVKAALDSLLASAPDLAGMKFVHWYDRDVENDPLEECEDLWGLDDLESEEEEPTPEEQLQHERDAAARADTLVQSVESGESISPINDVQYYILLLTGVGGRVMVRRYERGSYEELTEHLKQWQTDLQLTTSYGTGNLKPRKLKARMLRLLKFQKIDKNPFERMSKELSGITPSIYCAILGGRTIPLPDSVAARALAHIRSKLLADAEDPDRKSAPVLDGAACQWLKVWLIRNKHKGDVLMSEYNPEYNSNAYYAGAMMAIYGVIQKEAMKDVNVSVVERYYSSAIQTPALVIGRLSALSVYHLNKMENTWLADHLRGQLDEVAAHIQGSIPATLKLEQQAEFALGYYQMNAKLNAEKLKRIAEKKQAEQKQEV